MRPGRIRRSVKRAPSRAEGLRTSLSGFRDRLEIAGHERPIGFGHAFAAAAGQPIGGDLARQTSRDRGFVLLEGKIDVLAKRLPARVILFERFVAGSRSAELVVLRRGAVEPALLILHPAERLARALQFARVLVSRLSHLVAASTG